MIQLKDFAFEQTSLYDINNRAFARYLLSKISSSILDIQNRIINNKDFDLLKESLEILPINSISQILLSFSNKKDIRYAFKILLTHYSKQQLLDIL